MLQRRYKPGQNRHQQMLLPPSIEDYVSAGNPVRAIDAYVDTLDLQALGFGNTCAGSGNGQPPFPPSALLKLYLYGYLNRIHSSRRLEREALRNLEVVWLVEGLRPGYKTVANFRKDNAKALKAANRDFMLLCKGLGLYGGEEVAVDGSFFKADASLDSIATAKTLEGDLARLGKRIDDYQRRLAEQDAADDKAGVGSLAEDRGLPGKLARLKEIQAEKQTLKAKLDESPDTQLSSTDPDARLLRKNGKATAGYNVQIAVDGKHKLIVAADVTQDGNDTRQLVPMLDKAQEVLESGALAGTADTGYYSGEQIKEAVEKGYTVYMPVPKYADPAAKEGRHTRDQFHYDGTPDVYRCPHGKALRASGQGIDRDGRKTHAYRSDPKDCEQCPLRKQCLPEGADRRVLERWEHQAVVDDHKRRMAQAGGVMKKRSQLVEHPFGTLKFRAGMHHFLMRGLEKCRGEFSLMVLCYNFTRVLNTLGLEAFRDYCAQRMGKTAEQPVYG